MASRWLKIETIQEQVQSLSATEFELMFPSPVLVAAIVKQGKLVRPETTNATHLFLSPVDPDQAEEPFIPSLSFTPIHRPLIDDAEPWVRIGRTTISQVVINDYTVSKEHARMLMRPGRYQLEDVNSRNGTWIDGTQLRPFQPVELRSGQQVRLGRQSFTFFSATDFRSFILGLVSETSS
jgi:hypothetical protein